MLQIIIWMGSVYLVFKGWQMKQFCDVHFPNDANSEKWSKGEASLTISLISAVIFVILSFWAAPEIPRF